MNKYSSYILYLLITFLVVIISINGFGPLDSLQRSINDSLCSFTASDEVTPNIVTVTIDGQAQDEYGSWPWNHDIIADLLAATAAGEPKVIALDFMLPENNYQDSAGFTDILASQLSWINNLVIPYDIALATFRDNRTNNPKYLYDYSLTVDNPLGIMDEKSSLQVRKVFLPPKKLMVHDPYLGFDYVMPDEDRVLRHYPMVMNYEGFYYPSLPLITAALYLGVPTDQIKVNEGENIELGGQRVIPINKKSEFFVNFPKTQSIRKISALSLLSEDFNRTVLKNKVVIIDVDEFSSNRYFVTPISDNSSTSFIKSSVVQNIINNNILSKKDMPMLNLLILFLIGGACAFGMPQVSKMYRSIILLSSLFIMVNINYFLFTSFSVIINSVYIGLELVLFMIASPFLDSEFLMGAAYKKAQKKKTKMPKEKFESNVFGNEQQEAVPVREIVSSANDAENIKTTAISSTDSEDKSHSDFPEDYQSINIDDNSQLSSESDSTMASPVEDKTTAFEPVKPDKAPEPIIVGADSGSSENVFSSDDSSKYKIPEDSEGIKKLGRYQVLGTLGKGAMGHVYKGIDPAINRPVALKTIRLDFVSDPDEMAELKERLFREAQAAGKLSHPNIVTIYDVGSEGHLQYIAMEYLEGVTLEEMIKKKTKFNYKIISQIIIQICNALDYAHEKGIVHRDIKPANIMVLSDYSIKLMDYGIARIDSNSMTKTGIAMGTPNYISPEQLKGMTVDRRADIFSLGVVIYELLLGQRPFKGENITSLIYSITTGEPEKPSNINPQVPLLFDHVIEKALKKNPDERYQSAKEMIQDLSDFIESFA